MELNPSVGEREDGDGIFVPYWFSINNSKTVKVINLSFCSLK